MSFVTFSWRECVQDDTLIINLSGLSLYFPQDDDIDGEHIIAFAEESDPGRTEPVIIFVLNYNGCHFSNHSFLLLHF